MIGPDTALRAELPRATDTPPAALWWRIGGTCLPPLVAALAGWSLLAYRSGAALEALVSPSTWARWDTFQYLSIARGGYTAAFCPKGYVRADPTRADYLCGNAGWFPGYPVTTRGLSELAQISLPVAGLVVAWACWYLALLLMWQLLADARSLLSRWACLLIAAFFPGQVYFAALFPVSLCIAGMLGCLYAVFRGSRPALVVVAVLTGFVAAYSYVIAIVLAPALLVSAVLMTRPRRLRALLAALGIVAGFAAVLLTMRQTTGIWNAYFLNAEKYRVGVGFPLDTLADRLSPLWTTQPPRGEFWRTAALQTLLTLGLLVATVALTLGRAVRRPAAVPPEPTGPPAGRTARRPRWSTALTARVSPFDLCILMAALGAWLMPYIAGGQASTYRSEAFVILTVPLLRRLPSWLLLVPLAAAVTVAWRMAPEFFSGALV